MSNDNSSVESDPSTVYPSVSPAAVSPAVVSPTAVSPTAVSPAASLELQSNPKPDNNDEEKYISSGNSLPSSSNNKIKFEEDSESSVQPTKEFKQYSSDITSAGGGGEILWIS